MSAKEIEYSAREHLALFMKDCPPLDLSEAGE